METNVWAVAAACLGSTGLFTLLAELLRARREKSDKKNTIRQEIEDIQKTVNRLEKDGCRTQLLLMMRDYPDERAEIMQLAAHYFRDLKGNWYLSSLFSTWLQKQEMDRPEWFEEEAKR